MTTKKAFVSGHNYIQDIHMEPGVYTVLMKVKSMYGDVCSFALFDGTTWTHYDMDTVQGQWKWAYVTFRTLVPMTKINLISRNYSAALPVYVVEPQIVAGNVPFDAGVSPADLNKESKELKSVYQSMEYLKHAIGQDSQLEGALFTLVTILLKENMNADVTAGISGIQGVAKDEPAFWAGGRYDQAIGGTAKAIINHDGSVKFTDAEIEGKITATDGDIGGMKIAGEKLVSQNGKVVVDGISNLIYLKDEDSDAIRTILSPRKLPLSPSSYFGSSSPTNVSLATLQKSYSKNSSSVELITIPSGDSSAYQITIPPITMGANVSHPGDLGGGMIHMNNASIEVGISRGGILQYIVDSVLVHSAGGVEADTRITPLRSFTIQGSGTWSVRVTHKHTINTPPSSSIGNVTNINGNAIVAKVVNSSAIGSNGMIIATSGTEYTYMVGDTYEVRRGKVGFRITDAGIQKSSNMDSSYPTWNPI